MTLAAYCTYYQRSDAWLKRKKQRETLGLLQQHAADLRAQHMRANHARLDDKTSRKRAAHAEFLQTGGV